MCVLFDDTKTATFSITDTKLYVPAVTLSTRDNAKLWQQLKLDFKRTIDWGKNQSKVTKQAPNTYLDYLICPCFQAVNILFVLLFENTPDRTVHTKYYLRTVEIKDYNVLIDGKNSFDQLVKNNLRTYDNIEKILLDYNHFSRYYKMIAIDLSK